MCTHRYTHTYIHISLCVYCALTTEPWCLHDVAVLFISDFLQQNMVHTHKHTHLTGGLIKTYMFTVCGRLEVSGNHKGCSELSEHVAPQPTPVNTPPPPRLSSCNRINCQLLSLSFSLHLRSIQLCTAKLLKHQGQHEINVSESLY